MPNLIVLAILLIVGIFTFILSNTIWDLFGQQIKDKVSRVLPSGVKTDQGTSHK